MVRRRRQFSVLACAVDSADDHTSVSPGRYRSEQRVNNSWLPRCGILQRLPPRGHVRLRCTRMQFVPYEKASLFPCAARKEREESCDAMWAHDIPPGLLDKTAAGFTNKSFPCPQSQIPARD